MSPVVVNILDLIDMGGSEVTVSNPILLQISN